MSLLAQAKTLISQTVAQAARKGPPESASGINGLPHPVPLISLNSLISHGDALNPPPIENAGTHECEKSEISEISPQTPAIARDRGCEKSRASCEISPPPLSLSDHCRSCGTPLAWPGPVGIIYADGTAECLSCADRGAGLRR